MARFTLCILVMLLPNLVLGQSWRSVDQDVFARSIERQMAGRVMGFAFAVADRDGIVAEASGGWAQARGDGDLPMDTDVVINFGSNQKVLSGVALLDLLEERGFSLEQEVQTRFTLFMPDKWREFYFSGNTQSLFDRITLRDLLDHTSGLADEPPDNLVHDQGTKIGWSLTQPVQTNELNNNTGDYNNNNFTLLLYAIPNLFYRSETNSLEAEAAALSRPSDYNGFAAREYGALYTRYMKEEFLPRVPVELDGGTCFSEDLQHGRVAKQYQNRTSRRGDFGFATGFCRSQGSWSYSVRDMAHIMRTIELDDAIIKRSTRGLYPASTTPRMIFWRSFSHRWLAKNTRVDTYRGHGGRTPPAANNGRSNSVTIRLPFGHVGVAAVNSDEMNANTLGPVLLNAFYEATRKTFEKDVSRGGSDIADFDLSDPDPEVCRNRCNDRSNCRSWTYVPPGIQDPTNARCWLKSGIPAQSVRAGRISGVKGLEYGWDRPGSDLRTFAISNGDPAACFVRCAFDRNCKAYTFVGAGVPGQGGQCWLKSRVPPRKRASCCISGK
ncbi:MAG: PAN domain-containing protein [Pseudomonadota bacterium]